MLDKLLFEAKITDVEEKKENSLFSKCKIYVMYTGENRNSSFISKDTVENALYSIYNIPIIAEYIEEKDDFGSHGGKIEISDKGIKFIRTTMPYGVVPESVEITWETINEDGVDHEYLVLDGAYLWTGRYEEAIKALDGKSQSMEIDIVDGNFNKDTKVYEIKEMMFSALCILGDDIEPCFEGASLESYTSVESWVEALNSEWQKMIQDFKATFGEEGGNIKMPETFDTKERIEIDNSKDAANMSGAWSDVDKTALRNKLIDASNAGALVKEAYLIVNEDWKDAPSESLHYPHHEVKNGKLVVHKAGLEAAYARLMQNDPNNEEAKRHVEKHYKELGLDMSNFSLNDFSLTSEQLEAELGRILINEETYSDDMWWGWEFPRYGYVDNMLDSNIVIARDYQNCWLVGFEFSVNGDKVAVNFDTGKRYKIDYNPMDLQGNDGDENVNNDMDGDEFILFSKDRLDSLFSKVKELKDLADSHEDNQSLADLSKSFVELKEEFNALKAENDELKEFKAEVDAERTEREEQLRQEAEDALFERFASQLTEEEVTQLKEVSHEVSIEELENKIYILVGKKYASQFSVKIEPKQDGKFKKVTLPVSDDGVQASTKPWADIVEKYKTRNQ